MKMSHQISFSRKKRKQGNLIATVVSPNKQKKVFPQMTIIEEVLEMDTVSWYFQEFPLTERGNTMHSLEERGLPDLVCNIICSHYVIAILYDPVENRHGITENNGLK